MKKIHILTFILSIITILAVVFPFGVNAAPMTKNKDGVRVFHGKWVSVRAGIHQTLKIRCDSETNYCKLSLVAKESRSCTAAYGEPTDALLKGEGPVQVIDQTIELFVDAYCLTKPPTYTATFLVTFTYNEMDDTLTDNLGAVWYRK